MGGQTFFLTTGDLMVYFGSIPKQWVRSWVHVLLMVCDSIIFTCFCKNNSLSVLLAHDASLTHRISCTFLHPLE